MLPYLEMCAQTMSTLPPQLHPSFFSDFVEHFTTVFHLGLPITTKTLTVGNHQFSSKFSVRTTEKILKVWGNKQVSL
jgi:hypothetical protein